MNWFTRIILRGYPTNQARPSEEREITEFLNNSDRRRLSPQERTNVFYIDQKTLPTSPWTGVGWGALGGILIVLGLWSRAGISAGLERVLGYQSGENIVAVLFVIIGVAICWLVSRYIDNQRFDRDMRWWAEIKGYQRKVNELETELDIPLGRKYDFLGWGDYTDF